MGDGIQGPWGSLQLKDAVTVVALVGQANAAGAGALSDRLKQTVAQALVALALLSWLLVPM